MSIVAAGRPKASPHVAYVLSFGGHGSLPDVVRFLCTGIQPDGTQRAPHDYGVVVTLMNTAEQVVPPEQVAPLRAAINSNMQAQHLAMVDQKAAAAEFKQTQAMTAALPDPARTLMTYANARDVKALGPILLPHTDAFTQDAALSPARSTTVTAPVFLLHGADDNVVPAIESRRLATVLERTAPVHLLVTSLITHAEVDHPPTAGEVWADGPLLSRDRGRGRAVVAAVAGGFDAGFGASRRRSPSSGASARRRRGCAARHAASAARPGPLSTAASAW